MKTWESSFIDIKQRNKVNDVGSFPKQEKQKNFC